MNTIEQNAILYYADLLSIKATSIPVTDTCKYFFIHKMPVNIADIAGVKMFYDKENQYIKQATNEYTLLKDKFGEDGVSSFIDNLCNLGVTGMVDAITMLKYIHRYSDKHERNKAFKVYKRWRKNRVYTHTKLVDDTVKEVECSEYIAHFENKLDENTVRYSQRPDISIGIS